MAASLFVTPSEKWELKGKRTYYRGVFSDAEFEALFAVVDEHYEAVYYLAARTGFRQSELRELRWTDLKGLGTAEPSVNLRLETTKNDDDELLPLLPEVGEFLAKFKTV